MRMSCSGCRVLRKGCSDDCSIRPCLDWIKSSQSQANATVFLAKFYGRAGLMNLINAGPPHLRPAIFRSLLYEACGRIVNPIYGSAGLMWSGSWQLCHNAVEAVLKGEPVSPMATDAVEAKKAPPFKAYDIRHVNKEDCLSGSTDLRKRTAFKRKRPVCVEPESPSHDSSLSHQSGMVAVRETESLGSTDSDGGVDGDGIELALTLGFEPVKLKVKEMANAEEDGGAMDLGLDLSC